MSEEFGTVFTRVIDRLVRLEAGGYELNEGGNVTVEITKVIDKDEPEFEVTIEEYYYSTTEEGQSILESDIEREANGFIKKIINKDQAPSSFTGELWLTFSGSGDSGSVDGISLISAQGKDMEIIIDDSVHKLINSLCEGYELNDGGYGEFNIQFENGEYKSSDVSCFESTESITHHKTTNITSRSFTDILKRINMDDIQKMNHLDRYAFEKKMISTLIHDDDKPNLSA